MKIFNLIYTNKTIIFIYLNLDTSCFSYYILIISKLLNNFCCYIIILVKKNHNTSFKIMLTSIKKNPENIASLFFSRYKLLGSTSWLGYD